MTCYIIDLRKASSSPLNPLSARVRQYLVDQIHAAVADPNVTSLLLTGGPQHFSAGADLTEFAQFQTMTASKTTTVPSLIDVVNLIENCPKPVVAAIAGTCLGGGLEVALACHYRICTANAKLGLPEVHVGVIPGAGGTQRLPRLIGLAAATRLILTGAPVQATAALKLKLVDEVVVVPEDATQLLHKAQAWASWAAVMPMRRLGQVPLSEHPAVAHVILTTAALALPKHAGSAGPEAALEALRASTLPLAQGMAVEKECFLRTLVSPPGKARRYNFFAVRQAAKPYANVEWDQSHALLEKQQVVPTAIIGAGTMGGGIALVLLQAGYAVTLVDVNEAFLQKGVEKLQDIIKTQVKRKRMKPAVAQAMLQRLKTTTRLEDLANCQLVVEAVVENLPVKQNIFRTLDQITSPNALLLSNTSTLSIDAMASAVSPARRARFAGWHFFSPAHLMKLVEIVVGQDTAPETVRLMQAITKRVGKTGVVVGNCDGFCGNRLLKPYSAEMLLTVAEGVTTIPQVDKAIRQFGMAMGPFEMADLAGNDVGYNIRKERGWVRLSETDPIPPNRPVRYSEIGDILVAQYGRTGQKAGKGWYDYDPEIGNGRTPLKSPEVDNVLSMYIQPSGQAQLTPHEIIERLLYPLVNEGFKCLEEKIVQRPSDIDVVYVYGYGWPVWRGGPMYWADHEVGLSNLLQALERLSRQFPGTEHYEPSHLLQTCVRRGVTVEAYYQQQQTRSKL